MGLYFHQWRLYLLVVSSIFCCLNLLTTTAAVAAETDAEEAREKGIVDKFVTVLEKNPRRGTALDKVYGFHVERGSLNGLIKTYRDKTATAKGTDAASTWMIVGLLESLRGQDAAAVAAFEKAEQLDPANYLASYYLGQSQVLIGQPDKAAEALERATQRKPAQADQLDIFQALGRVYQRAQKSDKALEVWNRLEKQFPNDPRVQEQIAITLLEEGEFASALPRFENLAKTTKDKYRQSLFQMEAAEIKVRLGKSGDAIKEFEALLGQLNPDNWLFREVRRRIENVYLRTDDQAGLITYYESWMKKNPNDLGATSRLARLLSGLGRGAESREWIEKALKAAPTNKELRFALISQLMFEQKFADVIAQYEQLDKHEPNNPDTLRDWGRVILKDTSRDEATRKKDAATVWNRLTTSKPKDPLIASQVAELFRQAEMTDEALALYQKAISLAPESAQYKEYLGEYYHSLKRKDEALATWRQMAEGNAKTAPNVARLAEVFSGFGYLTEAIETNAEACKLDPKEINLQIKQVDLLVQAEKHDEALKQLDVVKKLAANDEEREAVLGRELKELAAIDKLKDRIANSKKELDGLKTDTASADEQAKIADKWYWLARALEYERLLKEAGQAIVKASDLSPQSIPILMASGRIQESQNNLLAAVEINTKLAAIDRRYRTEYLKKVAQLEMQLGRREKGIQAGRDLLAAAPGNPELYEFFSQLCFQLGETEEGLQALRRSVRVNPTEPKGLLLLAGALAEQFRTGEAIELYWRAFEKAASLDDRLGVVPKLAELYLQTNQLDRLLERLERQRREPNQQREMTICLAQAYQSAGDDGNARQELEKLLTEDTRDTQLLQQLVKLCESDGDLDMAVRYQQQFVKVSPGKESTLRLVQLLTKAGETEEAATLTTQMTIDEKDPEQVLKSIDALVNQNQLDQALATVQKLIREQPTNWELLYREGALLAKSKPDEAPRRFEAILAMTIKDDEQGILAKAAAKKAAAAPRGQNITNQRMPAAQTASLQMRVQNINLLRQAINLDNRNYSRAMQMQQQFQNWTPADFGSARLASIGWLMKFAQTAGKLDDFVKPRKEAVAKETSGRRELFDAYYLAQFTNDQKENHRILKRLSQRPDADASIQEMYLYSLRGRGPAEANDSQLAEAPADAMDPDDVADIDPDVDRFGNRVDLAPLDKEELEHVIAVAKQLSSLMELNQYSWSTGTHLELIAAELKRSGRKAEARKMYTDAIENAKQPFEIASVLQGVVQRGDYATSIKLLDRLAELAPDPSTPTSTAAGFNYAQYVSTPEYQAQLLGQLMANRAKNQSFDEILGLWNRYVALVAAREIAAATPQAIAAKRQQRGQAQNYGGQYYYNIWQANGQQRGEQLDFPSPNTVYDTMSIQMLRQMFSLYRDGEQVPQLLEVFKTAVKDPKTPEIQRKMWQFGLGYLYWWNEDKDEALSALTDAAKQLPESTEVKFEMARLHERRREFEEALTQLDAITPSDQAGLQQREVMALRLAVNGGNVDRARLAAERLFGLRLDSNLQMALARQMHQLGMHEQAEAVLARAGRQAGNRTDVLASLMEQYASTGKNDVAVQIAHQLLRRSKSGASSVQMMSGGRIRSSRMGNDDSGVRTQALQVLNRSGKLPEMIAKVEAQLKTAPKSSRLNETLLEYYVAAGNDKKVEEINARLAEMKGDDPRFKYQLAMKLLDAGKTKEANEQLKIVFEKDPNLVMNQYWELQNKYQNHNKLEDLASLYESIDMKVFRQQPYALTNAISYMVQREQTNARAIALFKKAWAALPDSRGQLLGSMYDDKFWKLPEIYDYAREGVIPTETMLQQNRWLAYNGMSYGQNGRITTLNTRVLDVAVNSKKLDSLAEDVAAAMKKMPSWNGGKILLGMIDLRKGRVDEGKSTFEEMLPTFTNPKGNDQYYMMYALREIGQELSVHDACTNLAIKYYESAVTNSQNDNNEFEYTAAKPLVELLKKQGRKSEARQLLINGMRPKNQNNDPGYQAYRRVASAVGIGKEFQELGFPADAIKLYQRVLANQDDLAQAKRYGSDHYINQIKTAQTKALQELKPESLAELLAPPPKPTNQAASNPAATTNPGVRPRRNPAAVEEPVEDFTSIDLIVGLDSQDMKKIRMTSALINLVGQLVTNPQLLEKTNLALAEATTSRPDDFGAAILATQIALASKEESVRTMAVNKLVAMTERLRLEAPPEKGGFTAKQRAAAMQQAQLWLVARECWKHKPLIESAVKLGTRSLEAAKRLADNSYALAILREWGQLALDAGDLEAAEQKWNEMLDLVIPKPGDKKKGAEPKVAGAGGTAFFIQTVAGTALRTVAAAPAAPAPPGTAPANPNAAGTGTKANAVTFPQFQKAAQIAMLAAENGLHDLSLKAIEQSLHAGPPLEAMQEVQQQGNPFGTVSQVNDQSQSIVQVQQQLALLEQLWRRRGISDERVYAVLRGAMLPDARPLEVFLYPQLLANSRSQMPQSIGALVVRAAVKANQTDDLKQRLEKKLGQPLGDLPARIALTQLALAMHETKTAGEHLDLVAERIKLDSIVNTSDLACHAAIPAIEIPELQAKAIVILERATDHYFKNVQNTRNSVEEPTRSFRFKLADLHFRNGNVEAGKSHLAAWVTQLASMWSNYGGDYPQYRRKSEYLSVAAVYARYGLQPESLELLGRHADLPVSNDYGEQAVGMAGAVILQGLAELPVAEQYAVLKSWSLPTSDRRSVRMMAALLPSDSAPQVFDTAREKAPKFLNNSQVLSTADLLVRSAVATGKLDELRGELEPFAAEDVEQSRFLLMLTRLAGEKDAKVADDLRAWVAARKAADAEADKNPNNNRRSRRPDATNVIVSQAAIANPAARGVGLELCVYQFERYSRYFDQVNMAYTRHLYNSTVVAAEQSAVMDKSSHMVDLKHWSGGALKTAINETGGAVPMWWLTHDGKVQHICGPGQSYLYLDYPLTGTFEFSCDIWLGPWADGSAGYGGLVFDTLNSCQIFPVGRRQHALIKPNALDAQGKYNHLTIQVTPTSIKNFVNGALTHEEPITSASAAPWLLLHAERDWQTAFTNLRIEGKPDIPTEISLSGSPSLLGWSGAFYGEVLPTHFKPDANAENNSNNNNNPTPPAGELDWFVEGNEIRGRQIPAASLFGSQVMQSVLQYCRPLRNGDRLNYEFWYEPGQGEIHVHPAIDRLAMILDPDGVKLHWLTESSDDTSLSKGLRPGNLVVDKDSRRGPQQLPLKAKDWNRVELLIKDDALQLSLNGKPVFERPLEPSNNRQFGFYHDKHATSVRVRNVVLKGNWPKSLTSETTGELAMAGHKHSLSERKQLAHLFDDKYELANMDQVLLSTRKLPPTERYQALKTWILPNDDHPNLRVYADYAPSDPLAVTRIHIPPVSLTDAPADNSKSVKQRKRSGGEMIAPVLDLVFIAKQIGKLEELAGTVRALNETSPFVKRSKLALLALIAIAENDMATAKILMTDLTPPRDKGFSDDLPANDRWPELIVATEATNVPELRGAAILLLELLLDSVNRKGIGYAWDVRVRSTRQYATMKLNQQPELPMASAVSPKGQWAQSTLIKAGNRAGGLVPRWRFQGTEVLHLGGEGNDLLYFQSPLRGKFTVDAELSTFGWREGRPMYGGFWAGPQYTHELADIGTITSNWSGPRFPKKLEPMGEWYRLRMDVTPDKVTFFANEQQIHEQPLNDHSDPWFAIYCYGHYAAAIRSLQFQGEPQIPDELQLSKREDLQGWWADMYSDPISGDNAVWKKIGEEIVGTKQTGWAGRSRESLLQYHRPMLENGEITYDFYYAPDQTHVHPALGRMVCLLGPDGVKIHWLTDAQFERGGLSQDNVTVEAELRRGPQKIPLKSNDWNKLALKIKGNDLLLTLNGQAIYEYPVEPDNLRTFGLFHYAGDSEVRVKNVVYRGDWPKALPPIDQQELASDERNLLTLKDEEVPESWSWNFKGRRPAHLRQTGDAETTSFTPDSNGLHIVRNPNPKPISDSAGMQWSDVSIEGDFEITLGYRGFESSTKCETHQVPRIEIILALSGAFNSPDHSQTLALTHRRQHDGKMYLTSILGIRRNPPAEDWQSSDRPLVASEGRIRIIRRNSMAYYLYSKAGSDDWELLERRPASTAPVKDLVIGLRSEDLQATGSVTLTEFSVRAKRVTYTPQFGPDDLPARFSWNFKESVPQILQVLQPGLPNRLEPVADGIKITRPDDPKQTRNPVGFKWLGRLYGDFEITLGYHDFESSTKMTDWQVPRIEIHVPIGGPEWTPENTHTVASYLLRRADGSLRLAGGFNAKLPDNKTTWKGGDQATTNTAGRLRMVRQGRLVFAMAAPPGSDDFKVIFSSPANDAVVDSLSCLLRSEGLESQATVVFTEFSIRAQSFDEPVAGKSTTAESTSSAKPSVPIVGPEAFGPKDLPAKITWNFQGTRPRFFSEWGTKKRNQFVPGAEGTKIIRAAKVDEADQAVGYLLAGGLDGDFEITLDYRDFASTTKRNDGQVPRVDISALVHSETKPNESLNVAAVSHRRDYGKTMYLSSIQGDKAADGKFIFKSNDLKTDRTGGRLRLVRQQTTVFYQVAAADSEEWVTISRGTIDAGPVKSLSIGLRAEDLEATADVLLTKITIRANAFVPK